MSEVMTSVSVVKCSVILLFGSKVGVRELGLELGIPEVSAFHVDALFTRLSTLTLALTLTSDIRM